MQLPERAWDFQGCLFDAYNVGSDIWLWLLGDNRRLFLAADTYYPVIYIHANREICARVTTRLAQTGALAAPPRRRYRPRFAAAIRRRG